MGRVPRWHLAIILVGALAGCTGPPVAPQPSSSPVLVPASRAVASGDAAPSPSLIHAPSPTIESQPSETTAVVSYSSKRFGYSIEYPAGWVVEPATEDWPNNGFPEPDGVAVDRFSGAPHDATWMFVSSLLLADGETGAGVPIKAKDMDDVRIAEIDTELPLVCSVSERVEVTVDGVVGRRQDLDNCFGRDYLVQILVSNDVRLYLVAVLAPAPVDDAARSRFERFVGSLRFRP